MNSYFGSLRSQASQVRITLKCVTESRRNPNHLDKIQKETRPIAKPILITNYEKKMNTFGTNLFRIELYFTLANFLKHPTISVLTTVLLQTKVTILNAELVSTKIFFFTLDKINANNLISTGPGEITDDMIQYVFHQLQLALKK